jgi:arylsulfatase A-like enzyme
MKIHCFVVNLLAALLLAPPLHAAEKPSMPNIVVILADDLGYGDVSCYNDRAKVPTPNLDRLAREGMRFTDAHSPATVCTPSRYSLMTGQMAFRVPRGGMVFEAVGGPSLIAPGRLTLPGMLRAKGYATACVGKWHVGLTFFDHDGRPIRGHGVEADHPNAQPRPVRDGRPRLQQRLHAGRAEWRDVCALPSHVALRADVVSYR